LSISGKAEAASGNLDNTNSAWTLALSILEELRHPAAEHLRQRFLQFNADNAQQKAD
jgi:hypothetical protein